MLVGGSPYTLVFHGHSSLTMLLVANNAAQGQGLTLVPISAQLELFRPQYDPA
jgi:hypothetical protein